MKPFYCLIFSLFCTFCAPFAAAENSQQFDQIFPQPRNPPSWSLLTIHPGNLPESRFGHTALRAIYRDNHGKIQDLTLNYGTFDPSMPGFEGRFICGTQDYLFSIVPTRYMLPFYASENRQIDEVVLQLSPTQSTQLWKTARENLEQPAYRYRLIDDNCSTRVADLMGKFTQLSVSPNALPSRRAEVHAHLDTNRWLSLGANLLLGPATDQPSDGLWIPLRLQDSVEASSIGSKRLLLQAGAYQNIPTAGTRWPLWIFSGLGAIGILTSVLRRKQPICLRASGDALGLVLTGLFGMLMLTLWLASDHIELRTNLLLIWLWPTHCIAAALVLSSRMRRALRYYWWSSAVACLIALALWIPGISPQSAPLALLPLVLLHGTRMWRLATAPQPTQNAG